MLSNTHFAIAVHVLSALAVNDGQVVPSDRLAKTVGTNPSFVRQVIGKLASAGLVETKLGKGGGARLARKPGHITLLDIYRATEKDSAVCRHDCSGNDSCAVARGMPGALDEIDQQLTRVIESELSRTVLAELVARHVEL